MAGPAYYEGQINIAQNVDWAVPFIYATLNSDGVTYTPINLTGSTIKMEIRVAETDHEAIVSLWSPDNGITFTAGDPTTGGFTITITRDKSSRLFPGGFVADIVRLMPNGYRERLVDATVTVARGTTK
jgi:hypothetical protein